MAGSENIVTFSASRYSAVWKMTYIPLVSAGLVALSVGTAIGSIPIKKSAKVSGALSLATSMVLGGRTVSKTTHANLAASITLTAAARKLIVSGLVGGITDTVTMMAARMMKIVRAAPLSAGLTLGSPAVLKGAATGGSMPASAIVAITIASTRKWLPLFVNFTIGTAGPLKAQALAGVAGAVSNVVAISRSVICPKTWSDGTAATFSDTTAIQYSN